MCLWRIAAITAACNASPSSPRPAAVRPTRPLPRTDVCAAMARASRPVNDRFAPATNFVVPAQEMDPEAEHAADLQTLAKCEMKSAPADQQSSSEAKDLIVFDILRESKCADCGHELLGGDFLFMEGERPLCLGCADLDHLVYLPRGDTALTRRARKHSSLSAVVVRFSRARKASVNLLRVRVILTGSKVAGTRGGLNFSCDATSD